MPTDFDALLDGQGTLGIAVSGGGDSVALLYALAQWSRRPLHVFHVDHRLQPDSAAWAQAVAGHAERLGLPVTMLSWDGDKPPTGLSAAARQARHSLLAQAARAQGIRVLCLAHTADDAAEAAAMRAHGSNVGTPRPWSPSPVWPQGRGVFLCRPFLDRSRAELRQWLIARGIGWIDDPANDNPASLRARVRRAGAPPPEASPDTRLPKTQLLGLVHDPEGWLALGLLRLKAESLRDLPPASAHRVLAAAAVCAGGGGRLPRGDRTRALHARLEQGGVHTLAGARIWQDGGLVHVAREPGDIGRQGPVSQGGLWDGRFELAQGDAVVPSAGQRHRLSPPDQAAVKALPPCLRDALPLVTGEGPHLALPSYGVSGQRQIGTSAMCWVLPRFLASAGRITAESDL